MLVTRQPYLFKNIPFLVWLLGTFVDSSCDIKINIKKSKLLYKVSGESVNANNNKVSLSI